MPTTCQHVTRAYHRVIMTNGHSHVAQMCPACQANVLGPGHWVPKCTVPADPDTLPIWYDRRPHGTQGELF